MKHPIGEGEVNPSPLIITLFFASRKKGTLRNIGRPKAEILISRSNRMGSQADNIYDIEKKEEVSCFSLLF